MYDDFNVQAENAARAYDRVAISMGKSFSQLNFPESEYSHEIEMLKESDYEEIIESYRHKPSGECRGVFLHKRRNRYQSSIWDNDKKETRYIGYFDKVSVDSNTFGILIAIITSRPMTYINHICRFSNNVR